VQTPDGIVVAIGAGQLQNDAVISIRSVSEANLALPMNPAMRNAFVFGAAFDFDITGAFSGPLQMAAPMKPGTAAPGDEIYFFVKDSFPTGPNGELQDYWFMMDSGVVGADGIARTASPPFPGVTKRGQVLIARASTPLLKVRFDIDMLFGVSMMYSMALGFAVGGGLAGAVGGIGIASAAASLYAAAVLYGVADYQVWRKYADNKVDNVTMKVNVVPGRENQIYTAQLPPLPAAATQGPITPTLVSATGVYDDAGHVKVKITVRDPVDFEKGQTLARSRLVFRMMDRDVVLDSSKFEISGYDPQRGGLTTFTVDVPQDVLLGLSKIYFQSLTPGNTAPSVTKWVEGTFTSSLGAEIKNNGGYGFISGFEDGTGERVIDVIDTMRLDEQMTRPDLREKIIKQIRIANLGIVTSIVSSPDLSRVFIGTSTGLYVLDAFTLQQFDADPTAPGLQGIDIPGGNITALAIDPAGRQLYVAGTGKVFIVDLNPASSNYHRVAKAIAINAPLQGKINALDVTADGKFLFVGVPYTTMFGTQSWLRGDNTGSAIEVINVNPEDKPALDENGRPTANTKRWAEIIHTIRQSLDESDGGGMTRFKDPRDIQATSDPTRLLFTSIGDLSKGLHTIRIIKDDPTNFQVEVKTISLALNKDKVDGGVVVIPFGDGTYSNLYKRRSTQVYDLDIRNASHVAVTPNLQYAFVGDWDVSRYMTIDAQLASEMEALFRLGGKVGIVQDPFNLQGKRKILAATTPIPLAFLEELVVDSTGRKLYANYRGIGNILVFDIDAMIQKAVAGGSKWTERALDAPDDSVTGTGVGTIDINLDGIDIDRNQRGLTLQRDAVLELVGPFGQLDTSGEQVDDLIFEWKVDLQKAGVSKFTSKLYVSAMAPGSGLWPDDPWRTRSLAEGNPDLDGNGYADLSFLSNGKNDANPGRIITSQELESGYSYVLEADGVFRQKTKLAVGLEGVIRVKVDKQFERALTAGQTYYWGATVEEIKQRASAAFFSKPHVPDAVTGGLFSSVTVLTHGMIIDPTIDLSNYSFMAPDNFRELAEMISLAGGGGIVLEYDKNTGLWWDRKTNKSGAAALAQAAGRPVILLSDWYRESDFTDSGYAEAAADAIFASIMDLDVKTSGNLLKSPLQFIGHGRGAVVNSEMIQRLGTYRSDVKNIQMTTLDPHDYNQRSMNAPLKDLVDGISTTLTLVNTLLTIASLTGVYTAPAALLRTFLVVATKMVNYVVERAKYFGIQIDPMALGDFKDPNITVWQNVKFADNYYQKAAVDFEPGVLFDTFTFTSNGSALNSGIDKTNDGIPKPRPAIWRVPDIEKLLSKQAGFQFDDVAQLGFGVGGVSDRVVAWYAGTVNVNAPSFAGDNVWRARGDQGLGAAFKGVFNPENLYNDGAWYFSNPLYVTTSLDNLRRFQLIEKAVGLTGDVTEGIGNGWFFSAQGGGEDYRIYTDGHGTPVSYDNTEVTIPPNTPAVPTVFNGDFESGTKASLLNYLIWRNSGAADMPGEMGRAPFTYELPGWDMHGGGGFTFDTSAIGFAGEMDFTGLFSVETGPNELMKTLLKLVMEKTVDQLFEAFVGLFEPRRYFGFDQAQQYNWYVGRYNDVRNIPGTSLPELPGPAKILSKLIGLDKAFRTLIDTLVRITDKKLNQLGRAEGLNVLGVDGVKNVLGKAIDEGIDLLFPGSKGSDYGLIFGLGGVISTLVDTIIPDGAKDLRALIKSALDQFQLNDLTHNRMYIPTDAKFLRFSAWTPVNILPDSELVVTFRTIDGQTSAPQSVRIQEGLFSGQEYYVEVPEGFAGTVSTFTISHHNLGMTEDMVDALAEMGTLQLLTAPLAAALGSISQFMILDDFVFSSVASGVPQTAQDMGAGTTQPDLTVTQAQAIADAALGLWMDTGVLTAGQIQQIRDLDFAVGDLGGRTLAVYANGVITIDSDAAGHGWFLDSTPFQAEEFTAGGQPWLFSAIAGGAAAGRYDLLSVLAHEMGHVIGLADTAGSVSSTRLMTGIIGAGERRVPSSGDIVDQTGVTPQPQTSVTPTPVNYIPVQTGNAGTTGTALVQALQIPATNAQLGNADFSFGPSDAGFAWDSVGTVSQTNGVVRLEEDSRYFSGLSQAFVKQGSSRTLSITIDGIALGRQDGLPPDAFEVALLRGASGRSAFASPDGLPGSDAIVNIQADGTIYFASGVVVSGVGVSGGRIVDLSKPFTITIPLAGLDAGETYVLAFDLLGFGALDSSVGIDVARIQSDNASPSATDGVAATAEDTPAEIDFGAFGQDPDGDALTAAIVGGPANGTLELVDGNRFVYRPNADFNGVETITYRFSDGAGGESRIGTLTLTVRPVNDPPVLAPVADRTVTQGDVVSIQFSGSDIDAGDLLTYALVSGPDGAVIDAATGLLRWTADRDAADPAGIAFEVAVRDRTGAEARRRFVVTVDLKAVAAPLGVASAAGRRDGVAVRFSRSVDAATLKTSGADATVVVERGGVRIAGALAVDADGRGFTFVPTGGAFGNGAYTLTLTDAIRAADGGGLDGDGDTLAGGSFVTTFTVSSPNTAPILMPIATQSVDEGGVLTLQLVASDADGDALTYLIIDAPSGASLDPATGRLRWQANDGPARRTIHVSVSDGKGGIADQMFDVEVADVAPTLVLSGARVVAAGADYALALAITDPGQDRISAIEVDWGDGGPVDRLDGSIRVLRHVYGSTGTRTITIRVTNEDGTFEAPPQLVTVTEPVVVPEAFGIGGFRSTVDGFQVRTTKELDVASLTVEGDNATVQLVDQDGRRVEGRLQIDGDRRGFRFRAAVDTLPPGTYTAIVLGQGSNGGATEGGIRGADGSGLATGAPDGVLRTAFTVERAITVLVARDDSASVMRGLPISIDVFANDEIDFSTFAFVRLAAPASRGTAAVGADNRMTYVAPADFVGQDRFEYELVAMDGTTSRAFVDVTVFAPGGTGGSGTGSGGTGGSGAGSGSGSTGSNAGTGSGGSAGTGGSSGGRNGSSGSGGRTLSVAAPAPSGQTAVRLAAPQVASVVLRSLVHFSPIADGSSSPAPGAGNGGGGGACLYLQRVVSKPASFLAPTVGQTRREISLTMLPSRAPGAPAISSWTVDWQDGTKPTTAGAADSTLAHAFDSEGVYRVKIIVETADGRYEVFVVVEVTDEPAFQVETVRAERDGFAVRFSRALNDESVARIAALVSVADPNGRPIKGTVAVDPDRRGLRFATRGDVSAGLLDILVKSGLGGLTDTYGCRLDGNGDGLGGDDFRQRIELPLDKQADAGGMSFDVAESMAPGAYRFDLGFDALRLLGVRPGSALPAGSSVTLGHHDDGSAFIDLATPAPIAAGTGDVIRVDAHLRPGADGGPGALAILQGWMQARPVNDAPRLPAVSTSVDSTLLDGQAGDATVTSTSVSVPLAATGGAGRVTLDYPADRLAFAAVSSTAGLDVRVADGAPGRTLLSLSGAVPGETVTLHFDRLADASAAPLHVVVGDAGSGGLIQTLAGIAAVFRGNRDKPARRHGRSARGEPR
jgi:hypothetical protein